LKSGGGIKGHLDEKRKREKTVLRNRKGNSKRKGKRSGRK